MTVTVKDNGPSHVSPVDARCDVIHPADSYQEHNSTIDIPEHQCERTVRVFVDDVTIDQITHELNSRGWLITKWGKDGIEVVMCDVCAGRIFKS